MADKDRGTGDGPSLELPSFSLRRKKKSAPEETSPSTPPMGRDDDPTELITELPAERADELAAEESPELTTEPAVERTAERNYGLSDLEPAPEQAEPAGAEPAATPEPTVSFGKRAAYEPAVDGLEPSVEAAAEAAPPAQPEPQPRRREPRERPRLSLPSVSGAVAAAIVGLVIGLAAVALTYLAMSGCNALRGTTSCGGPGVVLLLLILVLLIVAGSRLLALLKVADPGTTAFLAVAVTAVVCLLVLLDSLTSVWMLLVIPVVSALSFLASQWITHTFAEIDE